MTDNCECQSRRVELNRKPTNV